MPGAMTIAEVIAAMECRRGHRQALSRRGVWPGHRQGDQGPAAPGAADADRRGDVGNVAEWIKAGAVAVGVGSSLTGGAKNGDYARSRVLAAEIIEKIKAARGGKCAGRRIQ